jgi:hypothetical protein
MDQIQQLKNAYLAVWETTLSYLLQWPQERVQEWLQRTGFDHALNTPDDMLYHELPTYWLSSLLIPEEVDRRLTNLQRVDLHREIIDALADLSSEILAGPVDWDAYHVRIDRILEAYRGIDVRRVAFSSTSPVPSVQIESGSTNGDQPKPISYRVPRPLAYNFG